MNKPIKITREQWIIANQMASAVINMNAPFCGGGEAEGPCEEWLESISAQIADRTSVVALEDVIPVLQRALELAHDYLDEGPEFEKMT